MIPQSELPKMCYAKTLHFVSSSNPKLQNNNGVVETCITLNNAASTPLVIDGGIELHQCVVGVNRCANYCVDDIGLKTITSTVIVPANGNIEVCLPLNNQSECGLIQWDFYGKDFGGGDSISGGWCSRAPNNPAFKLDPYTKENPFPNCFGWTVLLGAECPIPTRELTSTPTLPPAVSIIPTPTLPPGVTPSITIPPTSPQFTPTPTKAPALPQTFLSSDIVFYIAISFMTIPPAISILYVRRLNSKL